MRGKKIASQQARAIFGWQYRGRDVFFLIAKTRTVKEEGHEDIQSKLELRL